MKREVPKLRINPRCNARTQGVEPVYLPHKALRDRLAQHINNLGETIDECHEEWNRAAQLSPMERPNREYMIAERHTQAYTRMHQLEYLVDYLIEEIVWEMEQELSGSGSRESDDWRRGYLAAMAYMTSKEVKTEPC